MPDAVPTLSRGTEPRIALWLGELKMAQPRPISNNGNMMRGIEESTPNDAIKNCPMTIRPEPAVQSRREPIRSDSHPAMGAIKTMTTEFEIKNCPMPLRPEPAVQSRREPIRSDSQPAMGAIKTMTTELAIKIQPIW